MGSSISRNDKVQPQEAGDFHLRKPSDDDFHKRRRTTTDIIFLTFMATFFVGLLVLVGYCMYYGDIFRLINGYDNCGNVCGRENQIEKGDVASCKGINMKSRPYVLLDYSANNLKSLNRTCVTNCSQHNDAREFFNRCIPKKTESTTNTIFSKLGLSNFFQEVSEDLQQCWREIVYMCLISLAFSIVIMILLRYFVGFVVWIVLIGVTLACIGGTALLWLLYHEAKNNMYPDKIDPRNTSNYLAFAIAASVVTVIVLLIVIVMRKRIQLVVRLFKEAGKAISCMPLLLIEPILTFASLGLVVAIWSYFTLWIESSGRIEKVQDNMYYYGKDYPMNIARWYNLLGMLWMAQFVIGCQHMIIAGAVGAWYFTRDKNRLSAPIFKSAYNLMRYHLGSVAIGSFLIALVQFVRIILGIIQKQLEKYDNGIIKCLLRCCQCCLWCFEQILKYLTRNAYIEVAIYGYSFCKGGRQAFKHLTSNVLRVTAINSVGDFVLLLAKVLVVISTVLIGIELIQGKEGIMHMWVPLALAGLFAYFVSHCFITVYEMAIDTIFLCFCEDCEQNDGLNKPYFMSKGLMEFVENSKKALSLQNQREKSKRKGRETPTVSATLRQ